MSSAGYYPALRISIGIGGLRNMIEDVMLYIHSGSL